MNVREMRNEVLANRVVKNLESRNMETNFVKKKKRSIKKSIGADSRGKLNQLGRNRFS